jgi:hypothetical protein
MVAPPYYMGQSDKKIIHYIDEYRELPRNSLCHYVELKIMNSYSCKSPCKLIHNDICRRGGVKEGLRGWRGERQRRFEHVQGKRRSIYHRRKFIVFSKFVQD